MKAKSAKRSKGSVGVVGLGIMGGAFAKHLTAAGFSVSGFDVAPAAIKALKKMGGIAAATAADLAAGQKIILTSLPSYAAFEAALFGKDGIAAGAKPGTIVLELSTTAAVRATTWPTCAAAAW